jgi:hypothetical protein
MYVSDRRAMRHRERIEDPTGTIPIVQQPYLGRLGRLTGPPIVTMGRLGDDSDSSSSDASLTTSGIFGIPWTTIGLVGAVLLGGVLLYKRFSGGGSAPKRRSRKFKLPQVSLPTVAMLGAVAYFYAKSQSNS